MPYPDKKHCFISNTNWFLGERWLLPVLRIRDVIPDPGSKFFPSRIRNKEFHNFNPKIGFQALGNMIRIVLSRSGSWIPILIFYLSRIQGSKRRHVIGPHNEKSTLNVSLQT